MKRILIKGNFVYPLGKERLEEKRNAFLIIENGRFVSFSDHAVPSDEEYDFSDDIIIPGLSDTHLHAPQYQFSGLYMDKSLLEWLNEHTFPEEAKYKDMEYAEKAYSIFLSALNKSPTTRLSCFASIHEQSSFLLASMLDDAGYSGYVGKVNMDRNSPPDLTEDTEESIKSTLSFIRRTEKLKNIRAAVTPRFVPSCTDSLMEALSEILLDDPSLVVQSHLCENKDEIEWVRSLHPEAENYASVYDRYGMLGRGNRSIMAHVCWPEDAELDLLESRNVFVAHSPSSNENLSSGIAPVKRMLERGINVTLSSDVAGGSSISMFSVIARALSHSRIRNAFFSDKALTFPEAFYLSCLSSSPLFSSQSGSIFPSWDADLVVISDSSIKSTLDDELSLAERLERYVYKCSELPVVAKFIKGRKVL